jgi:hypothetical protein
MPDLLLLDLISLRPHVLDRDLFHLIFYTDGISFRRAR